MDSCLTYCLIVAVIFQFCDAFDPDRIVFVSRETHKTDENHQYDRYKKRFGENDQGDDSATSTRGYNNASKIEIPLEMIQQINEIEDVQTFLTQFISNKEAIPPVIQKRFGDSSEKSNAVIPKNAGCTPELKVIPLKNETDDPALFYFPTCIKVERCGGCCLHRALACEPTENGIETVNYEVQVTQFTGSTGKFLYTRRTIIPIDKHTKCKCQCKIKAGDCSDFQEYSPNECQCKCKNTEDKLKCERDDSSPPKKLWDEFLCQCRCRQAEECSTGSFFDVVTCQCVDDNYYNNVTRRSVENLSSDEIEKIRLERRKYKVTPIYDGPQ